MEALKAVAEEPKRGEEAEGVPGSPRPDFRRREPEAVAFTGERDGVEGVSRVG